MADTVVAPVAPYTADSVVASDPLSVTAGEDSFELRIDRTAFAHAGDIIEAKAEYSTDGGKTWLLACRFVAGGVYDGHAIPGFDPAISSMHVTYPHLKNKNVLVRTAMKALKDVTTSLILKTAASTADFQAAEEPHSVAYDATGATATWANASSPVSWTHTPSGTPTAVGVGVGSASTGAAVTMSATYDGGSMGAAAVTTAWAGTTSGAPYRSSIFGLANPPSGAKTVEISFTNNNQYGGGSSISVVGSDLTTCFSNTNSAQSTGTAVSTNCTSATDELVMDHLLDGQTLFNPTVGGSQTSRWIARNVSASQVTAGSTIPGAASVTMDWTRVNTSPEDGYGHCLASFKLASAGGGSMLRHPGMSGGLGAHGGYPGHPGYSGGLNG